MNNSWYSIEISLQSGGVLFNGYFKVNNTTNLVIEFYETINGSTNFNNNILIPTGTGILSGTYLGFNVYTGANSRYDNVYLSNWLQFDYYGVIVNSMSAFPQYNQFNFWATNIGDETINNIGIVGNNQKLNCVFNIMPIADPSCFNEGTKILCLNKNLNEQYIPIENLKKGDIVKTYKHGYRKIDLIGKNIMINNPTNPNECMYIMKKTEKNKLIEDLIITGSHSILVDELGEYAELINMVFDSPPMIDDKYLLFSSISKDFIRLENVNVYTYYHFILENDGNDDKRFGVWANGLLVEIPSKNQFHTYTYN